MPRLARGARSKFGATLLAVGLLLALPCLTGGAAAAGSPPIPLALDRYFVENLTGADLAPGTGGALSMNLHDPLSGALSATVLTVGVYAFNAFPGNATSSVDVASAPVLSNATASGLEVNETVGTLPSGATIALAVPVQTSAASPSGTFAVRLSLRFSENGSVYRLASRGWFTAAQWAAATEGPNGTVDVNLTALGVSGILPETAVLVASNAFSYLLWGIFGVGVAVVAIGAWLYFRRSNSSSGARPPAGATQAPRAFGSSRTSDGD